VAEHQKAFSVSDWIHPRIHSVISAAGARSAGRAAGRGGRGGRPFGPSTLSGSSEGSYFMGSEAHLPIARLTAISVSTTASTTRRPNLASGISTGDVCQQRSAGT